MSATISFPKYSRNSTGQMVLDANADLTTMQVFRNGALDADVTATLANNGDGNYTYEITLTGLYSLYVNGQLQGEHANVKLVGDDLVVTGMMDGTTIEYADGVIRLKAGGIGATHIAANAIETAHYSDNSIPLDAIPDGLITPAKLSTDITAPRFTKEFSMDLSVTGTGDFPGAGGETGDFPVGIDANLIKLLLWDGTTLQNITSGFPVAFSSSDRLRVKAVAASAIEVYKSGAMIYTSGTVFSAVSTKVICVFEMS